MELKRELGSFTTVNGIRYTLRSRSYPKTKTVWDGGAAGGLIYPCAEDTDSGIPGHSRWKNPQGFSSVYPGGSTSKSFKTFVQAAEWAQATQRKLYERNKAFCAEFEAATAEEPAWAEAPGHMLKHLKGRTK